MTDTKSEEAAYEFTTLTCIPGNVYYKGTTRNFNPLVAMACDIGVVEAEKLLKTGEIEPEHIMTPGILVDYIVVEGEQK